MQSSNTQNLELAYQKKVEQLLQEQNCFKVIMVKHLNHKSIDFLLYTYYFSIKILVI